MIRPSEKEFKSRREEGWIPVWEEVVADCDTPASIFSRLRKRPSYLLESVEGGEQVARYSFLGLEPLAVLTTRGGLTRVEEGGASRFLQGDPLQVVERVVAGYRVAPQPELPRFFGGAVGYFGYDLVRRLERLPEMLPDDLGLPELCLVITRMVLIYDHVQRVLKVVALAPASGGGEAYRQAAAAIQQVVEEALAGGAFQGEPPLVLGAGELSSRQYTCNMEREQFLRSVKKAKEYIAAGDVFQAVLSQRWQHPAPADGFRLYRALRALNPSPYMFYLNLPGLELAGSSPEMLVRVEDGRIEYRPIAGTRRRGRTATEDRDLERELRDSEKERAEHLMLVDLGRNDLGRISETGTVRVERLMQVERYSHVMHLVSSLSGELAPGRSALDALAACFPAGTVTGAPKVRAMQLIEELEAGRRGPYAGAVGYLGFNGNLDTCITIRTAVLTGGQAYVQAGAGIVADSEPEEEYREAWNKARALLAALEMAEGEGRYAVNDR